MELDRSTREEKIHNYKNKVQRGIQSTRYIQGFQRQI